MPIKVKNLGLILLLIIVSFGVYFNTLGNAFVWDDFRFILDHPFIKNWSNLKYIFSFSYFRDPKKMLSLGMYNIARPVWVISAMIDYKIWGNNPFGHHLTNLILHSLSAVLVFLLLNLIFKDNYLSFLSSLIFALHPIHTETINVVTFRTDILAFVFMILAFIVFIKALDVSGLKAAIAILFSFALYIIANFAKEMAITLPVLLGLYLYLFVPKERLRRNKKVITFYFSIIGLIVIAYLFVHKTHFFYGGADIPLALTGKNFLYRLAVMSLVFTHYLRILFLPIGLCADYSLSFLPLGFSFSVCFAAILLVGIFISALLLAKKQGIISLAIFWFFITLLPVSNLFPIVNILAERYLYIPSVGFSIFLAVLFIKLKSYFRSLNLKRIINLLFIFLLGFYALETIKRNQDWKDNLTIWTKTVKQSQDNPRVHNNLGKAYLVAGRLNEAIREFQRTLKLNPEDFIAHANLAIGYNKLGRTEEAKLQYQQALKIKPLDFPAKERLWILHIGLGNDYLKESRLDEALEEYLSSLSLNPQFAPAYYNLGNIFLKKDMLKEAREMYGQAIEIDKYYAEAYSNLGVVFAKEGNLEAAREEWIRALKFNPNLTSAKENLEKLK